MAESPFVYVKPEIVKRHLNKVFSDLVLLQSRKRSIIFTDSNRTVFIKAYLGHWTFERANDEFMALQIARRNGLLCPKVYDLHLGEPVCWIASEYLNLPTASPQTSKEMEVFISQALEYIDMVHQLICVERAGHGWMPVQQDHIFRDGFDYLIKLIKPNEQLRAVTYELENIFNSKNRNILCSSLHRDLKIPHFLRDERTNNLYLLDWETVSRAPAVTDYVNFLFNILLYAHKIGLKLTLKQLERYLLNIVDKLPINQQGVFGLVLAWGCTAWASYGNKLRIDWALPIIHDILKNFDDPQNIAWYLWSKMESLPDEAV